jgi:hypothetical protein
MARCVDVYGRICYEHIDSRTMVDAEGSMLYNQNYGIQSLENLDTLIDDQYLFTTPHYIMGYAFGKRKWCGLFVNEIKENIFNDDAFNTLVLDETKKSVIESLITYY